MCTAKYLLHNADHMRMPAATRSGTRSPLASAMPLVLKLVLSSTGCVTAASQLLAQQIRQIELLFLWRCSILPVPWFCSHSRQLAQLGVQLILCSHSHKLEVLEVHCNVEPAMWRLCSKK